MSTASAPDEAAARGDTVAEVQVALGRLPSRPARGVDARFPITTSRLMRRRKSWASHRGRHGRITSGANSGCACCFRKLCFNHERPDDNQDNELRDLLRPGRAFRGTARTVVSANLGKRPDVCGIVARLRSGVLESRGRSLWCSSSLRLESACAGSGSHRMARSVANAEPATTALTEALATAPTGRMPTDFSPFPGNDTPPPSVAQLANDITELLRP